jgi:hypothetical protein
MGPITSNYKRIRNTKSSELQSFQSHKRWKQITPEIQEKGMSTELDERANKF